MTELSDYLRAEQQLYEAKRPLRQKAAMDAAKKRDLELKSAYAEGYKAGQEAMRERAAQHSGHVRWDGHVMWVRQDNILALPIEEPPAS